MVMNDDTKALHLEVIGLTLLRFVAKGGASLLVKWECRLAMFHEVFFVVINHP